MTKDFVLRDPETIAILRRIKQTALSYDGQVSISDAITQTNRIMADILELVMYLAERIEDAEDAIQALGSAVAAGMQDAQDDSEPGAEPDRAE